jgi:succinylarginine dihydrolase
MTDPVMEVTVDGLPGPTHHHAGLAYGNLASMAHRMESSRPRTAARQGLSKMKQLHDLVLAQAVLPPHERPDLSALRRLGFTGDDTAILEKAWKTNPDLLMACYSASPMWTANAATVWWRQRTCRSRMGIPSISVRHLGASWVKVWSRLLVPAARSTAVVTEASV